MPRLVLRPAVNVASLTDSLTDLVRSHWQLKLVIADHSQPGVRIKPLLSRYTARSLQLGFHCLGHFNSLLVLVLVCLFFKLL
jgi:hypothetical protein